MAGDGGRWHDTCRRFVTIATILIVHSDEVPVNNTSSQHHLTLQGRFMKTAKYGNQDVECYQDADLTMPEFVQTREAAKELWETRCKKYMDQKRTQGTAVIGAGFTVWYLPPRARKPQRKMILHSPLGFQGSLVWESSKDEVERVFTAVGIDVRYEWGSMD